MAKRRKRHLTSAYLNSVKKPSKGERLEITDECDRDSDKDFYRGLSVRITDKGKKYFRFRYRITGHGGTAENGRLLKGKNTYVLNLGEYPNMKLKEAREKAREYYKLANEGKDPADKLAEEIKERRNQEALTFKRVAEDYLSQAEIPNRIVGPRGTISAVVREQRRNDLNDVIYPVLGDRPISKIEKSEIIGFLNEVDLDPQTRIHPSRRDRMLKAISAVFYFATEIEGHLTDNPAEKIKKRVKDGKRERFLSPTELKAMWKATEGLGNFGRIIRVLAFTAQRSGEVRGLTWRDLDLENATWTLPSAKAKNRRVHVLPLTKSVLKIIEGQPRGKPGDYVFHGEGGGDKKTSTTPKQTIPLNEKMLEILQEDDPEAELEHWVPHDLRRTAKTNFAALQTPIEIADIILNHGSENLGNNDDVYNQYKYEPEIRAALDKWDMKLRQIVSGIEEVKETA